MPTSPSMSMTRHRFRWRVRSSSARYRLRRNGLRRLGGPGRAADRRRCSRRSTVDGVSQPGAAACGRTHRRRCARHGSGGPCRRSRRRAGPRLSARARTRVAAEAAEFLPLVRRLARFLPADVRVRDIGRAATGFRCPVLGVAPPLRLPPVHRAVRGRAAAGALRHRVAATTGRRRNGCRVAGSVGTARLRRVLPPTRRRHHHPRSAAAGLGARRRLRHRVCHRRRVLLVDGAVTGRCAAGGGGASSRTRLVRNAVDVDAALQRFRGGTARGLTLVGVDYPPDDQLQARTKVTGTCG